MLGRKNAGGSAGQDSGAGSGERGADERGSLWGKLKRGLLMTHTEMFERLEAAVQDRAIIDESTLELLEEALIAADVGVEASLELVDNVREDARRFEGADLVKLKERLRDHLSILLLDAPQPPTRPEGPLVTLLVGVNGVGKTTTAAKLAYRARQRGDRVLLAAADTFRAAAIEQLSVWADRLDVDIVKQSSGADPAAVVFDALQAARARQAEEVIIDTAGRLHTKEHLMAELAKIKRVVDREAPEWNRRTILVLDATTGQNAVTQARQFLEAADATGVFLAKIDGTAKGGVVVAIARELRLPVLYLGVGEGAEDTVEFVPRRFAEALVG
ncbi:MAG: signal recognition particle-docking protein FtsY [Thermoanaerobaculia bacterium]